MPIYLREPRLLCFIREEKWENKRGSRNEPFPAWHSSNKAYMTQNQNLFFSKFGITPHALERYLGEALSAGGEYADLYFEYLTSTSISVDEGIVKSASQGISAGCGVRVLSGERTGYAYTDDLAPEKILRAARTAALIARGPAKSPIQGFKESSEHQLYPVASPSADADIAAKLDLVMRADRAARAYDPRIVQVRAGYFDEIRQILVIGSDGTFATDVQPLARFSMTASPNPVKIPRAALPVAADESASITSSRKKRRNTSLATPPARPSSS